MNRFRSVLVGLLGLLLGGTLDAVGSDPPGIALTVEERQWLQAHPVITLAPDPDFKPIESIDRNGDYQGAAADIVRILERKLGIKITIARLANWDEAMAKFRNREVDLLGAMVQTPEREQFALFTDTLVAVPGGIFARTGTPANLSLKDLKGKRVAVVSNYAAHDFLRNRYPDLDLVVVPDVSTGLAKASLGMVDVYVENMANATFYAQEAGITNLQLVGKTDFDYRWGIGIRKDWPELQTILNKGLAAISKEERDQALQRWIYVEGQRWRPSKLLVIGAVAAALGIVLLVVIYWNHVLRTAVRHRTLSLQVELEERQKAEAALNILTDELEDRIRERTLDLEREVLERRRTEQMALASEQRFRELFENVADPIYIADMAGKLLAANDQACRELGYSQAELLGLHIRELDALFSGEEQIAAHFKSYSAETTVTFESEHRRKDRSTFPVEISVRVIDFAGQPAVMGVARNISERKRAEAERIQLEQQLLHAQKLESLGVLAGGIAHDFNNILTAILGNADLALLELDPESPVQNNLRKIGQAAARAADLAKQMLAYSGRGKFAIENLDLNRLLEELLPMLEFTLSKKAALHLELTRPLPSVAADATQLGQVVMNLVINASEAIGDRSGSITIRSGSLDLPPGEPLGSGPDQCQVPGRHVFLEITDTGEGMDPDTLARIFDPFFTTKFTGRGLGLAAVLGIVRGHQGVLRVASKPRVGTTFRVLLPVSDLPLAPSGPGTLEEEWQGSGKVLLVDDEATLREVGADMLRSLGFTPITAADGREALTLLLENPDLRFVLLDLTMPNMDGAECFRELRKVAPTLKIILASGYSEQDITHRFLGTSLAGFIQKPYTFASLRTVIRSALA